MAAIDPSLIKVVNWSRRRKRNKKLWKTTRSSRVGKPAAVIGNLDELRDLMAEAREEQMANAYGKDVD